MLGNSDKFQAIVVKRNSNLYDITLLTLAVIESLQINLLNFKGIYIDHKSSFDEYVLSPCKKASNQLNVKSRLHRYLGFKKKKLLLITFFYSNFNYCQLIWHFYLAKCVRKIEKIKERALKILENKF